jgi:hypothetical protein
MKKNIIPMLFVFFINTLLISNSSAEDFSNRDNTNIENVQERNAWLKKKFSVQHQKLIPVVAVADIFYACNLKRKVDTNDYQLAELVLTMDRDRLAQKLELCLGEDTIQSTVAIKFGLLGCFHEQLAHLPTIERQQKMLLVNSAIDGLSNSERKKSFTHCVTEQAIHYLK